MPPVKGSKQIQMKVVPDRPHTDLLIRISLAAALALVAFGAYFLGFSRAVNINGDARIERGELLTLAEQQQNEIEALKSQLLFSEQANIVDRQSLEQVQATLVLQQETIRNLEQDLSLYRQVMSPEAETGFSIGNAVITASEPGGNTFLLRVELLQRGDQTEVAGTLDISLAGESNDGVTELSLLELGVEPDALVFSFRYFQNIECLFSLPDGFRPESVMVVAHIEGKEQGIESRTEWGLAP